MEQRVIPRRLISGPQTNEAHHADPKALKSSLRGPARVGLLLIGIFVVGFGLWSLVVPLAGGAIAPGIISPDGSRRTVQHLEGGIISKLYVRDGDMVEAGQPLLELENVQPRANHDLLLKQQRTLRITKARLQAERLGYSEVEFPSDLGDGDPEIEAAIAAQRELFRVRRAAHEAQNRVLQQRAMQLLEQIKGFEAQVTSAERQIEFIAEEVSAKRTLARQGHITKPELYHILRIEAELTGTKGRYQAAISEAQQEIGETQLELVANDTSRLDEIATHLDQVQNQLNELAERLIASSDVLNRTVVTAPLGGTIVNLKFKTESGVIQPGAPILDIVPIDEKLVIDAKISPMDIDVVQKGLKAKVQLSAISARSAPRIDGRVVSVSADRLADEVTGQAYYLARVEIDRDEVRNIKPEFDLVPGMPADVLIVTGERTLANYMLRPFLNAVWKTLRET